MIGHCKAASLLCKTMCEQYVPNLLQTILQCFMMALFLRGGPADGWHREFNSQKIACIGFMSINVLYVVQWYSFFCI